MDSNQKMDELLTQFDALKKQYENLRIKNENNIDLTYSNIDSNNNISKDFQKSIITLKILTKQFIALKV